LYVLFAGLGQYCDYLGIAATFVFAMAGLAWFSNSLALASLMLFAFCGSFGRRCRVATSRLGRSVGTPPGSSLLISAVAAAWSAYWLFDLLAAVFADEYFADELVF